jgi:GNAT superfamily N-acetyltransferase
MACSKAFGHRVGVTVAKTIEPTHSATAQVPEIDRVTMSDGRTLILRHIQARDVVPLQRGFARLSPEEVRMRFLHPLTELPHDFAVHLCDLDEQTSVAFVFIDPPESAELEVRGVVRAYIDPTTLSAEFAIVVQRQYTGQGLGSRLMRCLIDECRRRGAVEIWGDVLLENDPMMRLCERMGFHRYSQIGDPGVLQMRLAL